MAFEQNQQNSFNLGNGIDQVKQFQAELDKATASIGAAELAAEEEQLDLKLKNLDTVQKVRLKQLDQLTELEEEGIQELAKLRQTLSDKQFKAKKKYIERELAMARAAVDELAKTENIKKTTKTPTVTKKTSESKVVKDIAATASKQQTNAAKPATKPNAQSALLEINKTLHDVDSKLTELQNSVKAIRVQIGKDLQALTGSQLSTAPVVQNLLPVTPAEQVKQPQAENPQTVAEPNITVELTPSIIVEPDITVAPAEVNIEPNVTVEPPEVNIEQAPITVEPNITVEPTPIVIEQAKSTPVVVKAQQAPLGFIDDLVQAAAAGVETELVATGDTISKTNKLLKDLIKASSITQEEQEQTEQPKQNSRDAAAKSLKETTKGTQKDSTSEDLAKTQGTQNNGGMGNGGQPPKGAIATAEPPRNPNSNNFTDTGMGSEDKVDLGEFNFSKIEPAIGALLAAQETEIAYAKNGQQNFDFSGVLRALGSINKKGEKDVSQTTVDLAGKLVADADKAEKAITKLREFNENKTQNMRLIQLAEEQRLNKAHADTELKNNEEKARAYAQKRDLQLNREAYLAEEENALRNKHITKQNELRLAGIRSEAKAKDLINNKAQYALETRIALQNDMQDKQNSAFESLMRLEESLAFTREHREELLAIKKSEKENKLVEEYQEYLLEAGEYAVSLEEYKKNNASKELANAKKDATSGITDAIKSGQFSKIWSADNKEAYTKYMGLRTAELKESYMAKFDKENPEATEKERAEAKEKAEASAKLSANFELVAEAAKNLAQSLNDQTDKIGEKQAPIDTRLQGSTANDKILGSYWKQLARDMNKIGAVNPYFTQEDFANNIETLVNKGISYDIKQRAFLMTIQEKIANTFDVADSTLLRLIRIQQQDTTAGRLGMESALNSFLNSMYETSEYLSDVASSVRSSLEEMQALMEGAAATEVEFQIQKWMGSLYSVGMSQNAVQDIATAFGQIASGDISGLTGNGAGNLLIMAANEAGKSIADILQSGLDAKETNELMQAMVNYLAEIAETSSDSRVVQQQLANVYGIKASDLRAATNLASSIKDVSNQDLTYSGMLGQLNKMANSMILRTSTGEILSNVWDNVQYTMATQMANDPILYLLPRVATLLEDYAGGIDLPFVNVMGFGVDLNTSVAQLMNVAAMSGSILGALGPMMTGLASAVSGDAMLSLAGINTSGGKIPVIARGSAQPLQNLGGASISESGYVGNSSGDDIKNATLQDAEDSKKKQMVEAKDEESSDDIVIRSQQAVIDIYNLLEEVVHGTQSIRVRVINNNGCCGSGATNPDSQVVPSTGDNGNWVLI